MASKTTLTNADLLKQFAQQNQGVDLKSTNQSGVVTDAPDVTADNNIYTDEILRRQATGDDDVSSANDIVSALNSPAFQDYTAADQSRMLTPALKALDNTVAGADGMTEQQRQIKALNDKLWGGSLDSPLGKLYQKALVDPLAPTFKQAAAPVAPGATTTLPGVTTGPGGTSSYDGSAGAGGLADYLQSLGHDPNVVQGIRDGGSGTAAPASGGNSPGQGGTFEGRDLQTTLDEFLESDPNLALNAALNRLRGQGTSQTFVNWFINSFDRFWGEYQGFIAQQAADGKVPDLSFVDYVNSLNLDQGYHLDAGPTRSGTQSQRFTEFLAQGTR